MKPSLRVQTDPVSENPPLQEYLGRLVKLVPAEAIGLYQAGIGVIPQTEAWLVLVWSVVCLLCVVLVRWYATADRKDGAGPQWTAIAIAVIAYIIWIYTLRGGPFDLFGLYAPPIGALLVLVWTFIVPYVYHGDT